MTFIDTDETDTGRPLAPERVQAGDIKYLTVVSRRDLPAIRQDHDVMSPSCGEPKTYRLGGNAIKIHPSRPVIFTGAGVPDQDPASGNQSDWGDSVPQAAFGAAQQIGNTMVGVASLIFEAKVDVIRIPDLMQGIQDPKHEKLVLECMRPTAMAKGIDGTLMLGRNEKYDSKSVNFGMLPGIMDHFVQVGCGAIDISATRMLGQPPASISSTSEVDLRSYYDRIQSSQELGIAPVISVPDECLVRSVLGSRPPEVHYIWNSLWQTIARERADIGKIAAETIETIAEARFLPEDALSKAVGTLLVENSVMPGLESALGEFGSGVPEDGQDEGDGNGSPSQVLDDATSCMLHASRRMLSAGVVINWAKAQGLEIALPAGNLHVIIAYSRTPVGWVKVAQAWTVEPNGNLTCPAGGPRLIEQFGKGVAVLLFNSLDLTWRHVEIRDAGASWDWSDYQPHTTFTYQPGSADLDQVDSCCGVVELSPEAFEEIDEGWVGHLDEE